jgi:IMP dehydrogenase
MYIYSNIALTYDDIILQPRFSKIKSRNSPEISLKTNLFDGQTEFQHPIISANMDTITEFHMANEMIRHGGLGILHRYYKNNEEYKNEIEHLRNIYGYAAISLGYVDDIADIPSFIDSRDIICVDVAHGHTEMMAQTIQLLRRYFGPLCRIIAGNVATGEGALYLAKAGANCIKVGIGGGHVCSTRVVTGHGVPNVTAIINTRHALDYYGYSHVGIIADGGIKNSGDIVKALACGADAVMIGGLLAGTDESASVIRHKQVGGKYIYRGQSSKDFMDDIGKSNVSPEGVTIEVSPKGPVKNIIDNLLGGIRSGMTYSGVKTIKELQKEANVYQITNSGYNEGLPKT